MSLGSLLKGFGGSAGKTVEAPLRAIVHEVLKEQGYASPAELQAVRDELRGARARLDGLDARIGELTRLLEAARAELQTARAPAAPLENPRVDALEAELHSLAERVETLGHATASGAALSAAPRGTCKVPECEQSVRSKGFCSAHYQQWRRGTLKGFVGLDGLAEVDGRVLTLAPDHAGGVVTLDGRRVLVYGRAVSVVASG